jgi:hypothetical protein
MESPPWSQHQTSSELLYNPFHCLHQISFHNMHETITYEQYSIIAKDSIKLLRTN